jgi:hypothetical protein
MWEEEGSIMKTKPTMQTSASARWTFHPGDIGEEEDGWGGGMQVASSDHEDEDEEEAEEQEQEEQLTPEPGKKQKVKAERTMSKVLTDDPFSSVRAMIVLHEDEDAFGPIHSPTVADGMTPMERARLQLSKKSETASARSRQKASLKMSLKTLAFSSGTPLDT